MMRLKNFYTVVNMFITNQDTLSEKNHVEFGQRGVHLNNVSVYRGHPRLKLYIYTLSIYFHKNRGLI